MGISIHLAVSKSVTREEWKGVYEETLRFIKIFPLAEGEDKDIHGIKTFCLVPTEEKETSYGWNHEKIKKGWRAIGDYQSMHTAENYYLPRDLVREDEMNPNVEDAISGAIPDYMDFGWTDERAERIYSLWGNKTQGEPYHMYLLAIACLIEARLGEKAFVYGDITRGQCKKAVELVNKHLDYPIDIPDRCDMERLEERISKLSLTEREKLSIFEKMYLGTKDKEFGLYLRTQFSEKSQDEYWKKVFEHSNIGTVGFVEEIKDYLLWGFDLARLCDFVRFKEKDKIGENQKDEDEQSRYEQFVEEIMDTKLYLQNKNCEDILAIDQEESQPYGISTLMAQFAFLGARNNKVDRYIPIEEIKRALKEKLAGKCNVDAIIEKYLEKEREEMQEQTSQKDRKDVETGDVSNIDVADSLHDIIDITREKLMEKREKYDVSEYEDLRYYESGDTMPEDMIESLKGSFEFDQNIIKEEDYANLMKQTVAERCEWLVEQNRSLWLRDKDWEKIFNDIEANEESYSRYYPMVRVKLNNERLVYLRRALALNDDLYKYYQELGKAEASI